MKTQHIFLPLFLTISCAISGTAAYSQDTDFSKAAQAYRSGGQPVQPINDTTVIAEAEEFKPAGGGAAGWRAQPWGANYYAATFANTFLSRKAFLGAPEQAANATASITVNVPKAGRYLALVRYEAAPNFETQFHLRVEQNGQTKLNRLYGARENVKIWAFRQKLQKEVSWSWGAVENMVWEGHDAYVDLAAGPATLTLVADKQPTPGARRNVDLVMLTSDEAQVKERIEKENYLPLDGMLTQAGDVYLKVHNNAATAMTLNVPNGTEHSSYWIHMRNWTPRKIDVAPGQTTDWVEVGSLLDSLNDGQWTLNAAATTKDAPLNYDAEFGVRDAAGNIASIKKFPNQDGNLSLAYQADTRYSRQIRSSDDVLYDLVDYLKKQPVHGTAPKRTLVYGYTFREKPVGPKATPAQAREIAKYNAAVREFVQLVGANSIAHGAGDSLVQAGAPPISGYTDVRSHTPKELEAELQKLQAQGVADKIAVVSLGDEIGLASPPANDQSGFQNWLKQRGLKPSDVVPNASDDWTKVSYNVQEETAKSNPALYYYSRLYANAYGIQQQKALTDVLTKYLPNAGIGANYSPHGGAPYLGQVHQYITLFREGGMTMPWGEDYVWQIPIGSQQMNFIQVDMFRSGLKNHPNGKIQMYVMPHWPGNTPNSWRRQFYGDLGHGAKIVNLFEFDPVQAAYTENHTSLPAMYQEVREGLHELGQFEDIIQDGHVMPGQAALWFSETGDIWNNNRQPFGAAKRALYVAILHQQLPLDFVVEQDALAGDLKNYKVLYLTDLNVSRAASKAIADWVAAGGHLFATAGAGMFDEFNQPNPIMRALLGVSQESMQEADQPIRWIKQDLPFAKPLDAVTLKLAGDAEMVKTPQPMPVFGARSRFTVQGADILRTFSDGSPAVTSRKVGNGIATYAGFLPGLSYFKRAIPLRPVDRGSTDDSMAHFIPTDFDQGASDLIGQPAREVQRPVMTSNPLVEASVVQAPEGMVVTLNNWSGAPVKNLTVMLNMPAPSKSVMLASGKAVKKTTIQGKQQFMFDLDVADALVLR
jgi:hypothetical protein